jgi:hypothetical protein
MFLAKDEYEMTACHMAAEKGQIDILQTLWEFAKTELTQEVLKSIFVAIDEYERTIGTWHHSTAN